MLRERVVFCSLSFVAKSFGAHSMCPIHLSVLFFFFFTVYFNVYYLKKKLFL